MEKFITDVSSIYWWISVFSVGIVLNLIGYYIAKKFDSSLSNMSIKWANKSKLKKCCFEREVALIKQSPKELNLALFADIRYRNQATYCLLLTICMLIIGSYMDVIIGSYRDVIIGSYMYTITCIKLFCLISAAVTLLLSMKIFRKAIEIREQIYTATKEERYENRKQYCATLNEEAPKE